MKSAVRVKLELSLSTGLKVRSSQKRASVTLKSSTLLGEHTWQLAVSLNVFLTCEALLSVAAAFVNKAEEEEASFDGPYESLTAHTGPGNIQ